MKTLDVGISTAERDGKIVAHLTEKKIRDEQGRPLELQAAKLADGGWHAMEVGSAYTIANLYGREAEDIIKAIVTRYNSQPALLAVAERMLKFMDKPHTSSDEDELIDQLRAAIRLTGKEI